MKTASQIVMIIALAIGILFLHLACSRSREEKEQGPPVLKQEQRGNKPSETDKMKTRDSIPEGVSQFNTLTPELFVEITIQYRKEHKKWLEEAQELPPDERSDFIENANKTFFNRLGITEDEYVAYSQNNIEILNAYIEEHPQLLPKVMDH